MQNLVNKIYKPKQMDKFKKVSRFEFEQRDIRQKLDTADIYLKIEEISAALHKQGIEIEPVKDAEEQMVNMVIEDRKHINVSLMELEYLRRQNALAKGSLIEKARKVIFGAAVSPEEALENQNIKVTVEPDPAQEEKLSSIMSIVNDLREKLTPNEKAAPVEEEKTEEKEMKIKFPVEGSKNAPTESTIFSKPAGTPTLEKIYSEAYSGE